MMKSKERVGRLESPRKKQRTLWQEVWRAKQAYLLLLPILIALGLFVYYPPVSAMYHAFFDWRPTGESKFIGLENFRTMLQDEVLLNSVWNMVRLALFSIIITTSVPLIIAEMIFAVRSSAAQYFYRFWFLVPVVVPLIVILLLWRFIYDPNVGLLNALLDALGLSMLKRAWLGDINTALYALMFLGFPFISGTNVLIYLAGLVNIPKEVMESAELDGVTTLGRIFRIDIPLLAGQIKLFLVLGTISALQAFEIQLVLTNGGPGWATQVPGLVMYQRAFEGGRFGYAAAIGLVLFVVSLILTILNFTLLRSSTEFEGRS
jgi:ABC-type sugar transport system permease subunit